MPVHSPRRATLNYHHHSGHTTVCTPENDRNTFWHQPKKNKMSEEIQSGRKKEWTKKREMERRTGNKCEPLDSSKRTELASSVPKYSIYVSAPNCTPVHHPKMMHRGCVRYSVPRGNGRHCCTGGKEKKKEENYIALLVFRSATGSCRQLTCH